MIQTMTIPDLGGYHKYEHLRTWPSGSIWQNEGERLYKLVRDEQPELVVEVGAYHGCSTTWIAHALLDNGKGKLISIDNSSFGVAWDMVPKWANQVVEKWDTDCFACKVPENIDILFEDGEHSPGFTEKVLKRFPANVVVCHDYSHYLVGENVRKGFIEVLGKPDEIVLEGDSDCGLAIKWLKHKTVQ